MSRRTDQISSILRQAIQEFISRGLNDPRVGGLVTVTDVRVSEDLKHADVMISVLPEEKSELSMHGLRHAATHIRRQVGDKVALRQMPQLNFKLDKSLKKQVEVLRALAKAAEVTPPLAPESPGAGVEGGAGGSVGGSENQPTSSSGSGDAAGNPAGNNPPGLPGTGGPGATGWSRPRADRSGTGDAGPAQEKAP